MRAAKTYNEARRRSPFDITPALAVRHHPRARRLTSPRRSPTARCSSSRSVFVASSCRSYPRSC